MNTLNRTTYQNNLFARNVQGLGYGHSRNEVLEPLLENGFPYSRPLVGHSSCVNALAISNGDGRFLASGGDDLKIQLWDFHSDDLHSPQSGLLGARKNIFNLAFTATNKYLLSGGADNIVLKFDIGHLASPLEEYSMKIFDQAYFRDHTDSIRGISPHPSNDEIFISGSEDGRILLRDGREKPSSSVRAQNTIQLTSEVTGVQFHPVMDNIFVTSDNTGNVCLRDARMAFGPARSRTNEGVVLRFNTRICKFSPVKMANPEASSVCFDRTGEKLCVTFLRYLPTIYTCSDPNPLATCSGRNLPSGEPASQDNGLYSNSCTMKHGAFGGPGFDQDNFYCAGSDDFRGYIWKLPAVASLANMRQNIMPSDSLPIEPSGVAFVDEETFACCVPTELSTPHFRLTGHRSIINNVVMHPRLLHVVTAGIEKHITLHSATECSPCSQALDLTPTHVRRLDKDDEQSLQDRLSFQLAIHGFSHTDEDSDEEGQTISMFDHILREERDTDPFSSRSYIPDVDDSDSDEAMDAEI